MSFVYYVFSIHFSVFHNCWIFSLTNLSRSLGNLVLSRAASSLRMAPGILCALGFGSCIVPVGCLTGVVSWVTEGVFLLIINVILVKSSLDCHTSVTWLAALLISGSASAEG